MNWKETFKFCLMAIIAIAFMYSASIANDNIDTGVPTVDKSKHDVYFVISYYNITLEEAAELEKIIHKSMSKGFISNNLDVRMDELCKSNTNNWFDSVTTLPNLNATVYNSGE